MFFHSEREAYRPRSMDTDGLKFRSEEDNHEYRYEARIVYCRMCNTYTCACPHAKIHVFITAYIYKQVLHIRNDVDVCIAWFYDLCTCAWDPLTSSLYLVRMCGTKGYQWCIQTWMFA